MEALNEANKEFLVESHENLELLDRDLVALEKDPTARGTITSIFRCIHTFKGSAGFLGFGKLESLAHAGESLLGCLRDGKLTVNPDIITALLALVDALREILLCIEKTGKDGEGDYSDLVDLLNFLREGTPIGSRREPSSLVESKVPVMAPTETLVVRGKLIPRPPSLIPSPDPPAPAPTATDITPAGPGQQTIRLDIGRLDKLMNLVSELVLARNQILQHSTSITDPIFVGASRHLNLITSELQEEVMEARLQPIGNVWSKFPRLVRDLAATCRKEVNLDLQGSETELDKSVIEAMKDPLTHLVRNAVDHGIEAPEVRRASGKPREGRLSLRAYHESGQVHIEIADDGAGIDPQQIKRKAIERGLLSLDQADRISDGSALSLIFLPGFSTAQNVSNISGRGVGMDVVKNNVEKIGGTVDIHSTPRLGTTIKMRIPLTLAIIRALIVLCAGQRYAIPQASVIELIRLEGEKALSGIERIGEASVYRFRGKLLPIVSLKNLLSQEPPNSLAHQDQVINIVVLQADEQKFGLIVDRIQDAQEIAVKPLGKLVRGLPCLAGATIMGDGRVALILDILGIGDRARVLGKVAEPRLPDLEPNLPVPENGQQLVLLRGSQGERLAVPLAMVVRLEEFPASALERTGNQLVVQYRGQILPLIDVTAAIHQGPVQPGGLTRTGSIPVVVCTDFNRHVGLMVDRILDIQANGSAVKGQATRPYVLFTTVVQQQVTEILDVAGLIQAGAGRN